MFNCDRLESGLKATWEVTPEGFLKVVAPVARTGVYNYRGKDGSLIREYISEDELFSEESLESFKLKPVTNGHPAKMITSDDVKFNKVGSVGETFSRDGNSLLATFIVTDSDAISAIKQGRKYLSPGYNLEKEPTNNPNYDLIQKNRRYNHLALVDMARGGADMAINFDGIQITKKEEEVMPDINMTSINLDGASYEVPVQVSVALSKAQAEVSTLTMQATEAKGQMDSLQATLDMTKSELETLKNLDHSEEINKQVSARVALISTAKEILGDKFNADSSDDEMKLSVIKLANPNFNADSKSSEYMDASFDFAVQAIKDKNASRNRQELNNDGMPKSSRSSRVEALENAYKGGK